MTRLLVDMNLSCEWIPLLRAAGHEAVHWSEVGDPWAPDVLLMQWASVRGYAVLTHDLDFGTMLALSGADGPSVVQVRSLNVLPETIGSSSSWCSVAMPGRLSRELLWWRMNAINGCEFCRCASASVLPLKP